LLSTSTFAAQPAEPRSCPPSALSRPMRVDDPPYRPRLCRILCRPTSGIEARSAAPAPLARPVAWFVESLLGSVEQTERE
jgi:hypothetical protein